MQQRLYQEGIATGIHYPIPLHLQKAYRYLGYRRGDFPVTEELSEEIISLPMYPELTQDDIVMIVEKIKDFVTRVGT
jgi:dTDP-4-amino-4,6-dideoxygalactose transaminase